MDHPEDEADSEAGHGRRQENSGETSGTGSDGARGKNLSPVDAVQPFDLAYMFEHAETRAGAGDAGPGRFDPLLNFASNAAFVACVLGFAFAAGTYFFGNAPGKPMKSAAAVSQIGAERAETLRNSQKMAEDIRELKTDIEALRSTVSQNQSGKDQRNLQKSIDALKTKLDAAKAETNNALAELSNKIDHIQHDPALKQMAERLDRIEKQTAAATPAASTTSMAKAGTPNRTETTQAKLQPAGDNAEPPKRLALITDWVVRDVYNGVALVENARGSMEVALGETIPGAGRVKAIERRGPGWIVITNRGIVDYDHGAMFPMN